MATNKFFSSARFFKMLKNDIMLNYKTYVYYLAGMAGGIFIWLVLGMTNNIVEYDIYRYGEIIGICLLAGGIFVGMSFPDLSTSKGAGMYLLLPASTFEKYLVQIFIRFIFFIPAAMLVFWITAHFSEWTAMFINYMNKRNVDIASFSYIDFFGKSQQINSALELFAVFSLGTFVFAARLVFKRFAIVKTIILGIAAFFFFICIMVLLSHIFDPSTQGFEVNLKDIKLGKELSSMRLFLYYIVCLSWIFFLPMGYFLLKEKQS
jgi:hypothetical protein